MGTIEPNSSHRLKSMFSNAQQRQVHTWQNEERARQLGALSASGATSQLQAIALNEDHPLGFCPSE